jgi:hypothetical protein
MCLHRVRTRHPGLRFQCPLHGREQTLLDPAALSAMGHKRKSAALRASENGDSELRAARPPHYRTRSSPEHAPVAVSEPNGIDPETLSTGMFQDRSWPRSQRAGRRDSQRRAPANKLTAGNIPNRNRTATLTRCSERNLAVCPTQGAPTSGLGQRETSQGQPLERRTAPSRCAVTWVHYDTSVR